MVRLVLVIAFVGLVIGALMPADLGGVASPPDAPPATGAAAAGSQAAASSLVPETGPSTVLERAPNGHFYAEAQVNGMPVRFVVDTGATGVALAAADAQRVGLQFSPADYEVIGSGASGPVRGLRVTLDRVTLGGKTAERVDGAILASSDMSLLGQSFLARMGRIEISGDQMIIR